MPRVENAALSLGFVLALAGCPSSRASHTAPPAPPPPPAVGTQGLLGPDEIAAAFPERVARSQALFLEASKVMLHPRCANCHPNGDSPLQGMEQRLHDPPVIRGDKDHGVVGMQCQTCHQDRNLELARVPGNPKWALAPLVMAWVGKSPHYICEQIKDPARNGGRTLDKIVEHSAHDELVAWGWAPGADREPAPGNQALFGSLVQAWVDTGAECPPEAHAAQEKQ